MKNNYLRLIFLFSLVSLFSSLAANIGEFDEYWRRRAQEAQQHAQKSYNPDPHLVVYQFHMGHDKTPNSTEPMQDAGVLSKPGDNDDDDTTSPTFFRERSLRGKNKLKKAGPCKITNPMDKCWRCRPNWAEDRFKLADCARGFGHKATGGKNGKIYTVTSNLDEDVLNPKVGTLRHAVIQKEPLWIVFGHDMYIKLSQELMINSDKTIDGRGVNVHIAHGAGITIQFVHNIIITNLHIHEMAITDGGMIRDSVDHFGLRTKSDGDGINIFGSCDIWLDHLSMSRCQDGLIDVIQGSTGITISNSHFTQHNDVILLGASDTYQPDEHMQVTVAYNHFGKGLIQRMPRCRWGFFHVVNNDYTHWQLYAIGGSQHPTILSQGNRFIAPPHLPYCKEVTKRDYATEDIWKHWNWKSEGDVMMNGAFFRQSGDPNFHPAFTRQEMIKFKGGMAASTLSRFAGPIDCKIGQPC